MKWEGNRESDNVEDRRDDSGGGFGGGGGLLGGRSIGIGTIVVALPCAVSWRHANRLRPRPGRDGTVLLSC